VITLITVKFSVYKFYEKITTNPIVSGAEKTKLLLEMKSKTACCCESGMFKREGRSDLKHLQVSKEKRAVVFTTAL
jgi:hypothetical protein